MSNMPLGCLPVLKLVGIFTSHQVLKGYGDGDREPFPFPISPPDGRTQNPLGGCSA